MVKRAGIISTMDRAEIGRLVGCSPEGIPLQTVISNGMPHCSSSDSLERTLSSVVQSESDHTPSTQQTRVTVLSLLAVMSTKNVVLLSYI